MPPGDHTPDPRRLFHAEQRIDDLYRILVESVEDYAIFVLDPAGRILSWNAGAERIKGYSAEEIIGRNYRVFHTEDARAEGAPEEQLVAAAREGRIEAEGWRLRKDGTRLWASVVITALYDDGELIGFGKVTEDRTEEHRATVELQRRERQLEEAQQVAHLGSWVYDLETDAVTWSDELYRIFGLDPGSPVTYDSYLEMLDPEDRRQLRTKIELAIETGTPYTHEHRASRPDGETRWVLSRGEVDRDPDSRPVRIVGTALDVTELKEAERQTRRLAEEQAARAAAEGAAERMEFLAEASALLGASLDYRDTLSTVAWLAVPPFADWCAVDMLDPEGNLNRLAVAHGDPDRVALAEELASRYRPDPDEPSRARQVLRSREPLLIEEVTRDHLEEAARDADHLEILEELGLESVIIVPIQVRENPLGVITFAFESGRRYGHDDLLLAGELAARAGLAIENAQLHSAEREARKRAERAGERTQRLQAITGRLSEAVTPDAVAQVIVDEGVGALEADSGSLVLGRPGGLAAMVRTIGLPESVLAEYGTFHTDAGLPFAEAIRDDRLITVEDVADREARYPELTEIRSETGTSAMVAVPLRTGEGVIGSLGFGFLEPRSFTPEDEELLMALGRQCAQALERAWLYETEHAAREEAEAASRAKSQFVAMMSHELRTPLSAIIGYQELLTEEVSGPINEQQRQHLARIHASATHLRDLINQILGLSRIDAGREELAHETFDLTSLLRDIAAVLEHEVDENELDLVLDLPDAAVEITSDPAKVRQIVINLLSNALKFTSEGSIRLDLAEGPDYVKVAVTDTGPGIAPEDQERIFDVFTQIDQSMTRSVGGSGLGLAVSRRLARLLGGELEVHSELGAGSTFTLHIPHSSG